MNERPIFDIGPVVGDEHPADGLDIGVERHAGGGTDRDLQGVRAHSQPRDSRRTGLLLGVLAMVIAAGALLAVPLLTSDNDSAQDAPATDQADGAENARAVAEDIADGAMADPVSSASFEPPSAQHLRADEVASLFEREIDNELQYGIAYVANDDFVVLDHRGITVPQLEIAVDFETASNLALLTNDGRTWAIDPANRDQTYLVSNSYVVVVSERPGTIAVIRPDDQTEIGLMSSALPAPSVTLPDGAELLWVQGRGPLVMPRTGGTFEVSGLASSLERISDDRAVAASATATIYEACDDLLSCTYFSQINQGSATELPFETGTEFTISPNGLWVVAASDSSVTVFDVANEREMVAFEPDVTAIDWAPDSSFVAIIDGDVLSIFYPNAEELLPMRLNHVPDENSLLVFAS